MNQETLYSTLKRESNNKNTEVYTTENGVHSKIHKFRELPSLES